MASKKDLSNEEILQLVNDFYNLSDEDRAGKQLGAGFFKKAYDLNDNYVIKEPHVENPDSLDSMVREYISSKQLDKHIPVEKPMIVTREGKTPVMIQRKLQAELNNQLPEDIKHKASSDVEKFKKILADKKILVRSADLHEGNIGYDAAGNPKVLDAGPFRFDASKVDNILDSDMAIGRPRMRAVKKILAANKSRVYRSVLPLLTGGAGLALSAAAEASDSPEAGDVLGQEALERDIAASKQMKQIEGSEVPKEVKLKALELFKKNRLPY